MNIEYLTKRCDKCAAILSDENGNAVRLRSHSDLDRKAREAGWYVDAQQDLCSRCHARRLDPDALISSLMPSFDSVSIVALREELELFKASAAEFEAEVDRLTNEVDELRVEIAYLESMP